MKQLTDHIVFRHGAETTNRIVQTPMLTNSGVNEMVTDATLDYYSQRSHSAGIVIVEYTNASINDRVSCQDSGDLFSFPYGCQYIYILQATDSCVLFPYPCIMIIVQGGMNHGNEGSTPSAENTERHEPG